MTGAGGTIESDRSPAMHYAKLASALPVSPSDLRSGLRRVPDFVACFALSVALACFAAGCTSPAAVGGSSASLSGTPTHSGPSVTHGSPAAKDSTVTRPGSGTLPMPKNLVVSVAAWDAGRGGTALKIVSGQVGIVLQAAGLRQYGTARSACVKLAAGITAAQSAQPIPDAAMQQVYKTALSTLARGAAGCRTAISRRPGGGGYIRTLDDRTVLGQSTSALSVGADDLYRATGEIDALRQH